MKRNVYRFITGIFLAGLILGSGCENKISSDPGILEGKITIGPICPVERIPPDPACQPTAETYKAYPVSVFTSDGSKKIASLNPSPDGTYNVELPPGNYLVVLERSNNNIGGSNLPVEVSIASEDKTFLDINIDTGIR